MPERPPCRWCGLPLPKGAHKLRRYHEGACRTLSESRIAKGHTEKRTAEREEVRKKLRKPCRHCGRRFTPFHAADLYCPKLECKKARDLKRTRRHNKIKVLKPT